MDESFYLALRDRTKITWHKLSAKVPKRLDILPTECQVIFEPTLRSNYFKVKDMKAFDNICQRYHMEKLEYFLDERVGFYLSINNEATFYDLGDFENLIMEEISCILVADQVCICFEIASCNPTDERTLYAVASAINSEGEVIDIALPDIYQGVADEFGVECVGRCEHPRGRLLGLFSFVIKMTKSSITKGIPQISYFH